MRKLVLAATVLVVAMVSGGPAASATGTLGGSSFGPTAGPIAGAASATPFVVAAIATPCPAVVVTNTTLKEDCVGPITIGADGVHLNLAGHTVTCNNDGTSIGIVIADRRDVHVNNGTVEQCGTGILILRGASNKLNNLTLEEHVNQGPAAKPPTGTFNFGTGLEIREGDANQVVNVLARANRIAIFAWIGADDNQFRSIELQDGVGPFSHMEIQSSSRNSVISGVIEDNPAFEGILISFASADTVVRAVKLARNVDGIGIGFGAPTGTLLQANRSSGNLRDGIATFNSAVATVKSNKTENNGRDGIRLGTGSTTNTVTNNTSRGNARFDLNDENPACDANVWQNNNFVTASQPCIS